MDKGLIVVLAVGAAFIYLAIGLFDTSSSEDNSQWTSNSSKKEYDSYYKKDSLGDRVLNLNSLDINKAKSIWAMTPVMQKVSNNVPDFGLAKAEADNALADGAFKTFVLRYIDTLQGRYLAGEVDSDKAKKLFKTLK